MRIQSYLERTHDGEKHASHQNVFFLYTIFSIVAMLIIDIFSFRYLVN